MKANIYSVSLSAILLFTVFASVHAFSPATTKGVAESESPKGKPVDAVLVLYSDQQSNLSLQEPMNCEDAMLYLDNALLEWHQARDTYLIVIARSGTGERSEPLNRHRLSGIEEYLRRRVPDLRYVTAEGNRVNGLGRVEIYVGGRLLHTLPIRRNADGFCVTPH